MTHDVSYVSCDEMTHVAGLREGNDTYDTFTQHRKKLEMTHDTFVVVDAHTRAQRVNGSTGHTCHASWPGVTR